MVSLFTVKVDFLHLRGIELKYAAVPYVIEIFEMLQAEKSFGCDNVLWTDHSMLPYRDPHPIFNILDQNSSVVHLVSGQPSIKWQLC